jgi:hypothetical protein
MSGTHDRARDAAQLLMDKLNGNVAGDWDQALEVYREEIETLADYVGVDKEA